MFPSSSVQKFATGFLFCFVSFASFSQDSTSAAAPVIAGTTKIEHLENNSEHNWFSKNYDGYHYDTTAVNSLKKIGQDYSIVVVGGTWCPDTQKELPRFYKVIDDGAVPREKVKLFFVDRELKGADNASKKYKVKHVPTFIVYRGEKEAGRIVTHPTKTIEEDLLKIVK